MSNAYPVVRPDGRSAWCGQVGAESQHLRRRSDRPAGGFAGGNVGQVIAEPEPEQPIPYELAGGEPPTLFVGSRLGTDLGHRRSTTDTGLVRVAPSQMRVCDGEPHNKTGLVRDLPIGGNGSPTRSVLSRCVPVTHRLAGQDSTIRAQPQLHSNNNGLQSTALRAAPEPKS